MVMPVFAVAWIVISNGQSLAALVGGRLLAGAGTGAISVLVPIYIADTAPTRLRGTLGCCNQLAVTFGILLVNALGAYVFRTEDGAYCDWRKLAFSFVVPCVGLFVTLFDNTLRRRVVSKMNGTF